MTNITNDLRSVLAELIMADHETHGAPSLPHDQDASLRRYLEDLIVDEHLLAEHIGHLNYLLSSGLGHREPPTQGDLSVLEESSVAGLEPQRVAAFLLNPVALINLSRWFTNHAPFSFFEAVTRMAERREPDEVEQVHGVAEDEMPYAMESARASEPLVAAFLGSQSEADASSDTASREGPHVVEVPPERFERLRGSEDALPREGARLCFTWDADGDALTLVFMGCLRGSRGYRIDVTWRSHTETEPRFHLSVEDRTQPVELPTEAHRGGRFVGHLTITYERQRDDARDFALRFTIAGDTPDSTNDRRTR
ncbi:MAG: hypothetical protein H6834_10230 [Planctomycetes bacterium]|nr:hypothetical protein [Planctomycetota bacterium]